MVLPVPTICRAQRLPRNYPMPFARAVTDKIEEFKRTAKGRPQLPANVPSALYTFSMLEWTENDVWGSAGIEDFYLYLRKCNTVKIPEEWKPFFPKKLAVGASL